MKKAALIINLGSPKKPTILYVWRFLREFLMDWRVIDVPFLLRFFLVNILIIPLRVMNSTKEYKKLWRKYNFSPILGYTQKLKDKLNKHYNDDYTFYHAMRYQEPSLESVLEEIYNGNYDELVILPLYPQYASASTGSTIEKCNKIINKWWNFPKVRFVNHFYNDQTFIDCFVKNIKGIDYQNFDHILFSYHGLPERHVDKTYTDKSLCKDHGCEAGISDSNKYCYKAMCYETTNLIAKSLHLKKNMFSVTFQSRLDNKWLKPFTDEVLENMLSSNKKNILVVSPAFVSDCLETSIEIQETYRDDFIKNGGKQLKLVPSLNDSDSWAKSIIQILNK
tara:strand:- start:539 stop:1546 length:1008 start_codon:yes stop_codon:yes gene_type:complete